MFVKDIQNFDLKQTFECEQCFRWNKCMDGSYLGIAGDYVIKASYKDGGIKSNVTMTALPPIILT